MINLQNGTVPHGLNVLVESKGEGGNIRIGAYELPMDDFLLMARYVLTVTDLEENDPRLDFIEFVSDLQEAPVRSTGRRRLTPLFPQEVVSA